MASVNQEIYTKKVEVEKDAEHPYAKIGVETTYDAIKDLKGYEFQLYILLAMNQIDFNLEFSPKGLVDRFGGSDKSWRNARDTLKKKGYLVQTSGNNYEFFEKPNAVAVPLTGAEAVFAQGKWDF